MQRMLGVPTACRQHHDPQTQVEVSREGRQQGFWLGVGELWPLGQGSLMLVRPCGGRHGCPLSRPSSEGMPGPGGIADEWEQASLLDWPSLLWLLGGPWVRPAGSLATGQRHRETSAHMGASVAAG